VTSNGLFPDWLIRTDPRLKVILLVLWSFHLAFLRTWIAAAVGLLGSLLIYLISGQLNCLKGLKSLLAVNSFLIFIWLFLPFSFSVPGTVIYSLGPLDVTREGFALSVILSLKALAITLGALAITGSSGPYDLLAGARKLGVPEKFTALFLLMTRYISVIGHQYHRLTQAMRVRGFRPGSDLHTLRSYANLAGLLLVRGFDRAERVYAAMLCRGYRGCFFIKADFKFKCLDLGVAWLFVSLGLLVAGLDVIGNIN
jgi:cobalt/nickel transport system permease protein